MSERHAHKMRALSGVDDELWDAFGEAVQETPLKDGGRSAVLRTFIRWYLGRGELPERPEGR